MPSPLATWMRRMRRLRENGYIKPPPLFDYVNKFLPPQTQISPRPSERGSYPEDVYVQAVYAKYPEVKAEPVELNSFTPPLARRFAWRQMEFIKEGRSIEEAFELAEQYFKEEIEQTQQGLKVVKSSSRIVQEEEERILRRALQQHHQRKERQHRQSIHS